LIKIFKKISRTSIKTLADCQLSRSHLQPLIELSTTIRLKCLGMLVERGKEGDYYSYILLLISYANTAIIGLGVQENWRVDLVVEPPRTELPDRFETELNELLPDLKSILSIGNFSGEVDLFAKEKWRQMVGGK
jgi:hypothetical protein